MDRGQGGRGQGVLEKAMERERERQKAIYILCPLSCTPCFAAMDASWMDVEAMIDADDIAREPEVAIVDDDDEDDERRRLRRRLPLKLVLHTPSKTCATPTTTTTSKTCATPTTSLLLLHLLLLPRLSSAYSFRYSCY